MSPNTSLFDSINLLNDSEIIERIKADYYNDEALVIAKDILSKRGVPIPMIEEGYVKQNITFRQSHPIWYWTFVGAICTAVGRLLKEPLKQLLNFLF